MFTRVLHYLALLLIATGIAAGLTLLLPPHRGYTPSQTPVDPYSLSNNSGRNLISPARLAGYSSNLGRFTQVSAVLTFPCLSFSPQSVVQAAQWLELTSEDKQGSVAGASISNGYDMERQSYYVLFSATDLKGNRIMIPTGMFSTTCGHSIKASITYKPGILLEFQATALSAAGKRIGDYRLTSPDLGKYNLPTDGWQTTLWGLQWGSPRAASHSPFKFEACSATSKGHNYNLKDSELHPVSSGPVNDSGSTLTPSVIEENGGTGFHIDWTALE